MKRRRIAVISLICFLIVTAFFVLRGPTISNTLKKLLIPELESATGQRFFARKVYINLFPLFLEIRDLKGIDDKGQRFITAGRIKGYIGLSGLVDREILIRRLVVRDLEINAAKPVVEQIKGNIEKYLAKESELPFTVVLKSLEVGGKSLSLSEGKSRLLVKGLRAEGILSAEPRFRIAVGRISLLPEKGPQVYGMLETRFTVKKETLELGFLRFSSEGSTVKLSGGLDSGSGNGEFRTEMAVLMGSIKEFFGLKNKGEGVVHATGGVRLHNLSSGLLSGVVINLKTKGDIYLETLMELLEVKEQLAGWLSFNGEVQGPLNDLIGKGKARLKEGNIYGVEIDDFSTEVLYKDGLMSFLKGDGAIYGGRARAEASITLPVVHTFTLQVKGEGMSSKGLFRLIRWDPGIPEGIVSAELRSSGHVFAPVGSFSYTGEGAGKDIIGRVKGLSGGFSLLDDIIHFPRLSVTTGKSSAVATGQVNLRRKELDLSFSAGATDLTDISAPYFTAVSGGGEAQGRLGGSFDDPHLELRFTAKNLTLAPQALHLPFSVKEAALPLTKSSGEVSYRKNLLTVREFHNLSPWGELTAAGEVRFPHAKALFDVALPSYNLMVTARDMGLKELSESLPLGLSLKGGLSTAFLFTGTPAALKTKGELHMVNLSVQQGGSLYPLADRVTGRFSTEGRGIVLDNLVMKRGSSVLKATGQISREQKISLEAAGENINLQEFLPDAPPSATTVFTGVSLKNLKLSGKGSLENPHLEAQGVISGKHIGDGRIKGSLSGRSLGLEASFFDNQCQLTGKAELSGEFPWTASAEMQSARYNTLFAHLLKEVPEDLLIDITGKITARGTRDHVKAEATFDRTNIHLFGIGFANSAPIVLRLQDRDLSVESFSLKSDSTEFKITGGVTLGETYDLGLEGSSSLAPLMALSKTFDLVKGSADFVFSLSGDWKKPRINGGMDVSNGSLGVRGVNYRITALSAFLYMDGDRIIVDRVSGKLSGGSFALTGSAYLSGFALQRFFLESRISGVTASLSRDLWAKLDGELYIRGTPQAQTLLGDITINKARYSERIEWKSWLLSTRPQEKPRINDELLRNVSMNVRVRGDDLVIDNNVAQAMLDVDFLLKGSPENPIILGKAEAEKGIVYFRNNEFTITKARADFSDPNFINPYFDIIAETQVINYGIRLALYGTMEQFNLAVSSDPALPESDIFSLLTVGRVEKELKGMKGGIGAGEATSFLTGKIQDVVEERMKTITGFDRVQVDSYVSKTTGTVTPRLTISKRLMGDKLYVTYSSAIGTGEEQVWKLEYILGKNVSLLGTRDEQGGVGGDVKFKFEFK